MKRILASLLRFRILTVLMVMVPIAGVCAWIAAHRQQYRYEQHLLTVLKGEVDNGRLRLDLPFEDKDPNPRVFAVV